MDSEQEINIVYTCGLCEMICDVIDGHGCIEGYSKVTLNENHYFYPILDDGSIVCRSEDTTFNQENVDPNILQSPGSTQNKNRKLTIQEYQLQCQQYIDTNKRRIKSRKRILAVLAISEILSQDKRTYKKKSCWVHPLYKLRRNHGFYEAIFPTLSLHGDKFKNYLRMTTIQFEELLCLVGPLIAKLNTVRNSIPAAARLAMTLRYLATGDSMMSASYQYLVGVTTVSNIIGETCRALWSCLSKKVLPYPLKTTDWLNIATEFENQWNFNHCIGAIDGKHVMIQCPDNAGSAYFNYKNNHSIVLLGICDANYLFTFVDIGAYGRRSDGGIFKDSLMGQKFNEKKMNVPKPEPLTIDGIPLPYVLVGDEAFQLTEYLLRPYPGRGGLNQDRSIFNYRLSRARRTIENSFGILVSRWRILKKPIEANVDNVISMIQAIICLHNWLRKNDETNDYIAPNMVDRYGPNSFIPGLWRQEIDNSALRDVSVRSNNNSSRSAVEIRNEFCDFFTGEGAIAWQYNRN